MSYFYIIKQYDEMYVYELPVHEQECIDFLQWAYYGYEVDFVIKGQLEYVKFSFDLVTGNDIQELIDMVEYNIKHGIYADIDGAINRLENFKKIIGLL